LIARHSHCHHPLSGATLAASLDSGTIMFLPPHFKIDDADQVIAFLQANNFGQLISVEEGRPVSTHMPFLISEDRTQLLGHFARANSQWQSVENQPVLITFQGPHDYISPSWYQSVGVPTWNYQAIYLYGECLVHHDNATKAGIVGKLTQFHEAGFEKPWQPDYAESMLNGIVGVTVNITEIQCKYKLSQNRSDQDRQGAIENLQALGSHQVAGEMKKQLESEK
jgi:transcriptional regulator